MYMAEDCKSGLHDQTNNIYEMQMLSPHFLFYFFFLQRNS